MKKILSFVLAVLFIIGCTACADSKDADTIDTKDSTANIINEQPLEYTYTLSENDIPNYNDTIKDHQFHILGNGYIVRKCASLRVGDSQYYFQNIFDQSGIECELAQYILDENGIQIMLREPYPKFYRVVVETDEGNIITATPNGMVVVYDKNWNVVDTADDIYYAAALDGGRYFAVNDTVLVDFDMGHPSYYEPPEIYALYRYTEKLTECKYSSIIECDGGYECIYTDENGEVQSDIIPVKDKIILGVADIVPAYNGETQKYYLADKSGVKIIEDEFDYISNVADNRAVVRIEDKFYILNLIVS